MRAWTEGGFSSVCYLLKRLEGEGPIGGQLAQAGRGAAHKVFRLTSAGDLARQAARSEAFSAPQRCCLPVLLGLSCLPAIPPAVAQAALAQYRCALAARLAQVEERWASQQPVPSCVGAIVRAQGYQLQAELAWIDHLLQQMEANHAGSSNDKAWRERWHCNR